MKTNRKLIIALGLVTTLLTISLVLNFILFDRGRQYYLQLNATRLDPLGLKAYPVNEEPTAQKPIVVFFGDSRAAQFQTVAGQAARQCDQLLSSALAGSMRLALKLKVVLASVLSMDFIL